MAKIRSSRRRKISELPLDILMYHILLRLPNKSLICCMCVSKQWMSLLKSNTFANVHLQREEHQNDRKLLLFRLPPPCYFSTMDCEAPHDSITACRLPPFKITSNLMWNISSCNGLVWVGLKDGLVHDKFSDLILWNPLTSEYKKFSKTTSHKKLYNVNYIAFELYYVSSEDDYRLLHVTNRHDVYVYSMKSALWRKIGAVLRVSSVSEKYRPGTLLNENLYFLRGNYMSERLNPYSIIILRFDTKTEKFREIATPSSFGKRWSLRLTAQRGCIHLCVKTDFGTELWRMNEDEVWMKVSRMLDVHHSLQPQYLMRNGNWLMSDTDTCNNKGHLYEVVLKNEYRKGETRLYDHGFEYQRSYIETFVSPKRYMK